LAPVINALEREAGIENLVCATGQHRGMLDQMLNLFAIKPDIDLDVMQPGQSPTQVAARVLTGMEGVFEDLRPDWLLVQGDTTTVMAAAIAAHYYRARVAHVEAGLRTYDRMNPFPEEMNRVVADHVSDLHLAPTVRAKDNLLREGISPATIFVTGNTVIDALLDIASRPNSDGMSGSWLPDGKKVILVTAHRRENHGRPLQNICEALCRLATRGDVHVVYAVHRNPSVWQPVHESLAGVANITLTPPLDYLPMVHLMQRSHLILTDSGGIQEEAPSLGVPVLVLRQTTERQEAVEAGAACLVGSEPQAILEAANRLLDDSSAYQRMAQVINPYGDGNAADRIVSILLNGGRRPPDLLEWQV